jgi:hypothetical protein
LLQKFNPWEISAMGRAIAVVSLAILAGLVCGCQPSASDSNKDSNATSRRTGTGSRSEDSDAIRLAGPKETVQRFLQALRAGDPSSSTALLTSRAQKETAARRLAIKPPGSQTAEFTVTEVELRGKNADQAQVLSTWTDIDTQGLRQTYDIVWLLRKEPAGWAIMGMATRVFDDQDPLILDFENPEEMMRERSRAEQEMARRTQNAQSGTESARVADQPDSQTRR